MADVVIVLKIMPESPTTDLAKLKKAAEKLIAASGARLYKDEIQPVAFGLRALLLTIVADEDKGSTDALEEQISKVKGVESVMVTSVSRALG